MRICLTCKIGKPEEEYYVYPDRTLATCRDCWNARHMTKYAIRIEWMWSLKEAPCTDCNIQYPPPAMEWDHVRGVKFMAVSAMTMYSEKRILAEIEKCDLVCANCHNMRTYNQRKRKEIDYRTEKVKQRDLRRELAASI